MYSHGRVSLMEKVAGPLNPGMCNGPSGTRTNGVAVTFVVTVTNGGDLLPAKLIVA